MSKRKIWTDRLGNEYDVTNIDEFQQEGGSIMNKTIKIYVEGGCVTDVTNLPDDFDYQIIDSDVQEEE